MKSKGKLFSIVVLLFLSFSAISTNVFGQITYIYKFKAGDEFIFTITSLDPVFGAGVGMTLGDRMKFEITDITTQTDYFKVDYDTWDFIPEGQSFSPTADDYDWEDVYKDPSDGFAWIYYFVLTPVSDYLAAYAYANSDYSSSGNTLTETDGMTQYISTYDSNGVLSKSEYRTVGGTVLGIISRGGGGSSIPGYDLPILIGLTAIAGVSIIYIMKKKMVK